MCACALWVSNLDSCNYFIAYSLQPLTCYCLYYLLFNYFFFQYKLWRIAKKHENFNFIRPISTNIKFECEVQWRIIWIQLSRCNCFRQYFEDRAQKMTLFCPKCVHRDVSLCLFLFTHLNVILQAKHESKSNRIESSPIGTGFYFSWDVYAYKCMSSSLRCILLSIVNISSRVRRRRRRS